MSRHQISTKIELLKFLRPMGISNQGIGKITLKWRLLPYSPAQCSLHLRCTNNPLKFLDFQISLFFSSFFIFTCARIATAILLPLLLYTAHLLTCYTHKQRETNSFHYHNGLLSFLRFPQRTQGCELHPLVILSCCFQLLTRYSGWPPCCHTRSSARQFRPLFQQDLLSIW